ncbi:zf-HC2 domain-containing protein [Nocardioides sp. CN2-186]|uniref:anti-sigma factor family protein n=1 Tax=Nocardioides tweenelious TaxID=3156607 RepID=UPI0032B345D7
MTCPYELDGGAYVLGALAPEERLVFERHLASCPSCSRAVREFAGLPGLLAQVPLDVVESVPAPEPLPETLLPSLVREVRRGQRRRRVLTGLVAAAAVLAVGTASVVAATALTGDDTPSAAPTSPASTAASEPMTSVDQNVVQASVSLTSVGWGTRLDLECSYTDADEHPPGYTGSAATTYAMVVRSTDGDVEQVATWKALPGKTMHLTGATALVRDDIAAVEIRTADGRPVLELAG